MNYMQSIKIPKDISMVIGLAVALVIFRAIYFNHISSLFMIWNIFLAVVPLIASSLIVSLGKDNGLIFTMLFFFWLIMIPNAPYLVTDLIHMVNSKVISMTYDSFILFTVAWLGMMIFARSMEHVDKVLERQMSSKVRHQTMLYSIFVLISFGIYLGRVFRFNSWDVFTNPRELMIAFDYIAEPGTLNQMLIFVLGASFIIGVYYRVGKRANM
jgi:uncharacterized membrane protein